LFADPGAAAGADGARHLGWVAPSDASFFDYHAELRGEFRTQLEAPRADTRP
jgi:hypothetical protein